MRTPGSPEEPVFDAARWEAAWRTAGAGRVDAALGATLWRRWAEPHRHYHSLLHLCECLALFDEVREHALHEGEVELALWFHDAVYVIGAADNEQRSAQWLADAAREAGLDDSCARRMHALVMATRHDALPTAPDAQLLVDVDLAILGAAPARFDEYEAQIRAEYSSVDAETFAARRAALLERFLARATIYSTPWFIAHREPQARANLVRSIARLRERTAP